jgi:putative ATPase
MPQNPAQPLADRIRPETLDDFIGQAHLVGDGKPLHRALTGGKIHSMIFWGPPGVGKTTLAQLIAQGANRAFYRLSAVAAGKADIRAIIQETGGQPGAVLFLDEIHRFNKAQQDFLLPYVEDGTLILIGATTENPSFEVISALLSRSQVYVLKALTADDIAQIIRRGMDALGVAVEDAAVDFLAEFANGDARKSLNLLEATSNLYADMELTVDHFKEALQSKQLRYDKNADEHYDTISAYIKSMRASDVDAALYYLARMIDAGEDPKFIARRMVIFASEDIGMAVPTALVVANEVFRAVETIGYPECQYNLAHGTVYLALAKKDRSSGDAFFRALDDVKRHGNLPIPMQLRNAPTRLMRELGYGKGDDAGLPDKLKGTRYYQTSEPK